MFKVCSRLFKVKITLNNLEHQERCDEIMNVKAYLQQIKVLDTKIKQKEEQIEYLKEAAGGAGAIRYDKDKVQTSCSDSKLESMIIQYMTLEQEVQEEKLKFEQARQKIINQIHELNDDRYINVLFKRYVELKGFEKIAVEMDYNYDYVRELHALAINAFEITHTIPQ